jgi:inorganic pyrophosphatase/exopolyphosphatase
MGAFLASFFGKSGSSDAATSRFPEWANTAKSRLSKADTFVMGNDAADTDSIISSIVFAYICELQSPGQCFVPVIKVQKSDMKMRRETKHLLEEAGIDFEQLIYYSDEVHNMITGGKQVILTDHNKPDGPLQDIWHEVKVVKVIDHHLDSGAYGEDIMRLEKSNSCCFLIAEELYKVDNIDATDHSKIMFLLLGVCLLDTKGFTNHEMTDFDINAEPTILAKAKYGDHMSLYKKLKELRENKEFWKDPDPAEVLRYDFKSFPAFSDEARGDHRHVGAAASSTADMRTLFAKESFLPEVQKFMTDNELSLLKVCGKDRLEVVFAANKPGQVDLTVVMKAFADSKHAILKIGKSGDEPFPWIFTVKDEEAMKAAAEAYAEAHKGEPEEEHHKEKGYGRGMVDLPGWL